MSGTGAEESAGDYSYDLAHEAVSDGTPSGAAPDQSPDPVQVRTDTPADQGGDYSYDLAHEVPPAGEA